MDETAECLARDFVTFRTESGTCSEHSQNLYADENWSLAELCKEQINENVYFFVNKNGMQCG